MTTRAPAATRRAGRCPHALVQDCPLYWAAHDGGGGSCIEGKWQHGCAVDRGASYDALAGKITAERYAQLRGMLCRPTVAPGASITLCEFTVTPEPPRRT